MNTTSNSTASSDNRSTISSKSVSPWQTISIVLSTLLVICGALGLVYLQKPLRETQYIQPEASVDVGLVTVSSRSTTGAMSQGVPSSVIFSVDTAGAQIHGVQLVFNVVSNAADNLGIKVLESSGLKTAFLETERTNDGYLVGVVALPQEESAGYSTTAATDFLEIEFTPRHGGTIEFNFDVEESFASLYGSEPLKDELTHIETIIYHISGEPATSTTTVAAGQAPAPDPNSTAQCNETCTDNSECPINHRCVDVSGTSRCRLATNISSEYCSTKLTVQSQQTASQTTFAQCNEQCTRHADCAAGFACLEGACRHPQNPDNTSCQEPLESDLVTISQSCNSACTQNSDCATNLRCFSGSCRLATNVSSSTCAAGYTGTVSSIYNKSKGGDISNQQTGNNTPQPGIGSGVSDEINSLEGQVTSAVDEIPPDETVWEMLKTMLQTRELSLPLLILFAGSWLFILAVAWLIVRTIKDRAAKPKPLTPIVIDRSATEISSTSPILEIKKESSSPITPEPTTLPPSSTIPKVVDIPVPPATSSPTQIPPAPKTSMMQRVRDKGISPPSPKSPQNDQ